VKHPNFDLMHSISFFSWFVFDKFIIKGEEYVHKVGRTLANRVIERRNMINAYLRGRTYIESVRRSLIQVEFLSLSFSLLSLQFAAFHASCWLCIFSLLLDDILEFFLSFGLLAVLHGVLDSKFKLYTFCCQYTHQGGDSETKWSKHWFDCDESLTCHDLNSNPRHFRGSTTVYLVWRITFTSLVVCR
jgi:hypothetical protein